MYHLSYLNRLYAAKHTNPSAGILPGTMILSQADITGEATFDTFAEFRAFVLNDLRYPSVAACKAETYGWVATRFHRSTRECKSSVTGKTYSRIGRWRSGEFEIDGMSVLYLDIDNDDAARPFTDPETVVSTLAAWGVAAFTYTSFSASASKPKFRLVLDIDRHITRLEARDLFVLLNHVLLGGQGDGSIYDPSDYLYAPPHHSISTSCEGVGLPVDGALEQANELRARQPNLWEAFTPKSLRHAATAEQQAAHMARQSSLLTANVRPQVSADNPTYVRSEWIEEYRLCRPGQHYSTLLRVMCRVWSKSRGTLTVGEMDSLCREIDARGGGYCQRKYGEYEVSRILQRAMNYVVPDQRIPSSDDVLAAALARKARNTSSKSTTHHAA